MVLFNYKSNALLFFLLFLTCNQHLCVVVAWPSHNKISTTPFRNKLLSNNNHQRLVTSHVSMVASSSSSSSSSSLPETRPLAPHTFAGMVEQGLLKRFDEKEISRVLTSWRLLDQDYNHDEYVGSSDKTRETSDMVQICHSYVPGLSIKPFWDTSKLDWAQYIESKYKEIRKEFDLVTADMKRLQEEGNNIWAGALTTDASAYGEGWKTLVLMNRGRWDPVNAQLFPKAAQAIHKSGVPATEVFFASLPGPSSIKKHSDFTNFVLTSHLALDIPYNGQNKCRISVGDETMEWINGQVSMFDTSLLHDAVNESDKTRYILMMRLWHPDLTEKERQALQFTYDCLEVPGLVSDDPTEQFMAERTVEAVRAFPQISAKTGTSGGVVRQGGGSGGFGNSSSGSSKKGSKKAGKRKGKKGFAL